MKHPNGQRVFGKGVDGRSSGAKRAKHLIATYTQELGGAGRLNVGEAEAIKRLASLTVLVERQEALLVADDPRYNADHHLRACGNLKRIIDDLDLPKKRRRGTATFDDTPDLEDDDDPNAETLEEYLSRPETIASAKRPINIDDICGKDPNSKRKRTRL